MNNIQITNEDCLVAMGRIPDCSIDCVITDPPYKTTARGSSGNTGGMLAKKINMQGKVFKANDIVISDWLPTLYNKLKEGGHCYIMTNHVNLHNYLNVAKNTGFHFIKSLIWDKGNKITGRFYMSQFEYILFLRKGKGVKINNCGTSDIISIKNKKTKDAHGENIHDTEKPVALLEILIQNSSNEDETILDPFFGSGNIAIACLNTERNFMGSDLDKDCYNGAVERLGNHKKQLKLF